MWAKLLWQVRRNFNSLPAGRQGEWRMLKKIFGLFLVLLITAPFPLFSASVFRDANRFQYGAQRAFAAPFQIPVQMFRGTAYGPLVTGTVGGALYGTFRTFGDLMSGAFDMAAAAAPYAKYALLF